MQTAFIVAWSLFAVFGFHFLIRYLCFAEPIKNIHSTVPEIKDMLAPPHMSLSDMLTSRALPNARLVNVFQLTNTFVSADLETHNTFRKRAVSLLHDMSRNGGWPHWAEIASQAVCLQLPSSSPDVPYDRFVQAITFRTVITGLLNPAIDPASFDRDNIHFIASTINTLWDHSKRSKCLPPSLLEELNVKLRVYFPDEDTFPNPLDFLIPSWETLWRVVAAAVANVHRNDQARNAFLRFRNNPNVETFRMWADDEPSVEAVIVEILRLHPPTKRIVRALPKGRRMGWSWSVSQILSCLWSGDGYTMDVADVEAVQRSVVWSVLADRDAGVHADATCFNPARHRARTNAQSETMMAFGYGRVGCVAKEWAPIAAGLIVAAVLDHVDGEVYEIITGPKIGGRVGWDGWFVRNIDGQTPGK